MSAKPLQVWLVDDDASIRWVLEKALKGSGMLAKCFDGADNALTALDLSFAVENPSGVCSSTQKLKS